MSKTRKTVILACLMGAILLLTACGGKLPEGFTEEDVTDRAEATVRMLNERDYDGVAALFAPVMADALSVDELAEIMDPTLEELGAFDRFLSHAVSSGNSEPVGDYAIAVLVCRYEKGRATYTVCVDEDDRICGLYIK